MCKYFLFLIMFLPVISYGQKNSNIDTSRVYSIVEIMPTLLDGSDAVIGARLFIQKEMVYPDSLDCGNISTIIYEFVISYDGMIKEPRISFRNENKKCLKDYDKLRKNGIDVLNKMPRFRPGVHNGRYVNVKIIIPLHIDIQ